MNQTVISARKGWALFSLKEAIAHRYLLYLLVWREVKTRYKQSFLGAVWIILQPLSTMVIYSIFFGYIARFPSEGVPYPIYILAGITCWQFFTRSIQSVSTSLADHQALLSKIYFPRILAPAAALISAGFDFVVLFVLLIGMMMAFGIWPSFNMVIAFGFVLLLGLLAFAVGLILTGLDAVYRDVRHGLSVMIQVWYFCSPIIYPAKLVPAQFRPYYFLNPASPLIQGFRWAMLGGDVTAPPLWSVGLAVTVSLVLLGIGLFVFSRFERTIIDYL